MYRALVIAAAVADYICALASRLTGFLDGLSYDTDRKAKAVRTNANIKTLAAARDHAERASKRLAITSKAFHEERAAIEAAHPYV